MLIGTDIASKGLDFPDVSHVYCVGLLEGLQRSVGGDDADGAAAEMGPPARLLAKEPPGPFAALVESTGKENAAALRAMAETAAVVSWYESRGDALGETSQVRKHSSDM